MEIGMRITQLREECDWKKTELARRLGISHSQVSRIESGETGTLSSDILIWLYLTRHFLLAIMLKSLGGKFLRLAGGDNMLV